MDVLNHQASMQPGPRGEASQPLLGTHRQQQQQQQRPSSSDIAGALEDVDLVEPFLMEQVEFLGELQVPDCGDDLKEGMWRTCGSEHKDIDWQGAWLQRLIGSGNTLGSVMSNLRHLRAAGGKSTFTLEAFVVAIKDPCRPGREGLIRPLLQHFWAGSLSDDLFETPAVRAVVQHKWRAYGRPFMIAQLVAYSIWLLSFTSFVILMNMGGRSIDNEPGDWHGPKHPAVAFGLLILSTVTAAPFLLNELRSMAMYGISYLAKTFTTDLLDIMIFGLHIAIVALVANNGLWDPRIGGNMVDIDVLIAVQVTLLWAKLPYFFSGFKLGKFSPIDTLEHVVYESRFMLMFILFMMFGFGVGWTTLFQRPGDEGDEDFSSFSHSLVTCFVISQGLNVNINEMYNSRHGAAAVLFFVFFEFLISIVMFNTLLSLMVGAFDKVKELKIGRLIRKRAELMDEADGVLSFLGIHVESWSPSYIHGIRLKRTSDERHGGSGAVDVARFEESIAELETRMTDTENRIMERLEVISSALLFSHASPHRQ